MDFVDSTYQFISYVNSNKNKISKVVINTALLFIVFAVFGCFDFANFSVNPKLLGTWKYWTKVFTKTLGASIAFNIGINLLFDREIEKDNELVIQADKYKRLNAKKNEATFNYYVTEVFNKEQKKLAYKAKINRKIYWLNKFARNKDKVLYSSNREDEKLFNNYCIRRKELEELKSDEYINKNIDSIIVNYKRVDPIIFELEIDGSGTYHGIKVKGSVGLGRTRLTSGVVMSMVLISMFFASIMLSPDKEEFVSQAQAFWHYVLVCCEDVGIILFQTFRGMISARKLVSQEMTEPLVGRNHVLDKYFAWVIDNDVVPSKGQQIAKILGEGEKVHERENKELFEQQ